MKRATLFLLLAVATVVAAQAQTRFLVTIENVGPVHPVLKSGVFDTPVGAAAPAPIFPGEAYEFSFTAGPGMRLSLATMFVQSNDAFYAFAPDGLALFDASGDPVEGDVTGALSLWDAGTEVDEEPGVGPNQAPRQPAPDTGADEDGVITEIGDGGMDDGFEYPANDAVLRVTLTNDGATGFTVRIENASDAGTLATSQGSVAVPLSPGT
ncbi:MAG: spondin domain-containing protein, partial [Rhodothermales bacterium]|nr:spondin domain-containing protein [Rhodothermales bacterium]